MGSWQEGELGSLTFISAFVWLSSRTLPVSILVYDMGQSLASRVQKRSLLSGECDRQTRLRSRKSCLLDLMRGIILKIGRSDCDNIHFQRCRDHSPQVNELMD